MNEHVLLRTLQVDGIGTLLFGLVFLAGARPIADAVGVGSAWPIAVVGVLFALYGIDNLLVARRPGRRSVAALVAADAGFAAAAAGIAIADPWGATGVALAGMVVLALASATMGTLKWVGRAALEAPSRGSAAADRRQGVVAR